MELNQNEKVSFLLAEQNVNMALRYADSATDLKLKAKFSDTRSESPLSMPEQKSEASPQQETELTFKSSGNSFSDSDLTDDFR